MRQGIWSVAVVLLSVAATGLCDDSSSVVRREDVIYGRKYGVALTMDVLTPKNNANGLGVIWAVSGGWVSSHASISPRMLAFLTDRGYTVFAVCHGCQPKFSIPEILQDMHRAVRFIRFHAKEYGIDPDRIGICGASAGGHLSLMQGVAGAEGDPRAKDPIDRVSSRVQAVACFFPPTDFLNYGKEGLDAIGRNTLAAYAGAFDFRELDRAHSKLVPVTDEAKIRELGKQVSPITHVTPQAPPTLIIHGDKDFLVPIQQAQTFIDKLKEAKVECKLVVKPGAAHGWPDFGKDLALLREWFDQHLQKKTGAEDKKTSSEGGEAKAEPAPALPAKP